MSTLHPNFHEEFTINPEKDSRFKTIITRLFSSKNLTNLKNDQKLRRITSEYVPSTSRTDSSRKLHSSADSQRPTFERFSSEILTTYTNNNTSSNNIHTLTQVDSIRSQNDNLNNSYIDRDLSPMCYTETQHTWQQDYSGSISLGTHSLSPYTDHADTAENTSINPCTSQECIQAMASTSDDGSEDILEVINVYDIGEEFEIELNDNNNNTHTNNNTSNNNSTNALLSLGLGQSFYNPPSTADLPQISWDEIHLPTTTNTTTNSTGTNSTHSGGSNNIHDIILGKGSSGVVIRAIWQPKSLTHVQIDVAIKLMNRPTSTTSNPTNTNNNDNDSSKGDYYRIKQRAMAEASIMLQARNKLIQQSRILECYGIVAGKLPLAISQLLLQPSLQSGGGGGEDGGEAVGILMRYEAGGSLQGLLNSKMKAKETVPMVSDSEILYNV